MIKPSLTGKEVYGLVFPALTRLRMSSLAAPRGGGGQWAAEKDAGRVCGLCWIPEVFTDTHILLYDSFCSVGEHFRYLTSSSRDRNVLCFSTATWEGCPQTVPTQGAAGEVVHTLCVALGQLPLIILLFSPVLLLLSWGWWPHVHSLTKFSVTELNYLGIYDFFFSFKLQHHTLNKSNNRIMGSL